MRSVLRGLSTLTVILVLFLLLAVRAASAQELEQGAGFAGEATLGRLLARLPSPDPDRPEPPRPLVLRRATYDVEVVGPLASIALEQEFVNDTPHVLEAAYAFPLPEGAAVHWFEMEVGDRLLLGTLREKQEARAEMQRAREEGRRASLLEQQRPNAFSARVTNLSPGDVALVRLVFGTVAPFEDGVFRLRLPLVIGDRHPGTRDLSWQDEPVDAGPRGSAASLGRRLHVDVTFPAGQALAAVRSPTHPIAIATEQDGGTRVELSSEDLPADRDFVLEYALAGGVPVGAVSPASGGWREALLTIPPPPKGPAVAARSKEVLFVLDTSGSMSDGSLDAARAALTACLRRLGSGDLFDVVEYDDDHQALYPETRAVDEGAVGQALHWLSGLRADGGTLLLPALEDALAMPASRSHHRIVIVLTDGFIGNEAQVLASLDRNLGDARLFVIAIGAAPNLHLAREMAERGRGAVEVLSPGSAVEQGAARLFARVESPLLWDLTLDWHGAQVTDVFPERLPDLYAGLPVTVLARVRDAGPVRVSVVGESPEGVRSFDVVLDARGVPEHPVVGVLWARAALEELEDDLRLLAGGAGELTLEERAARQAEVRAELVDLSLDTGLVSSATSFVVVETERTARPGGPDLHHRVTAERVAAWPQTATARPVRLSTGLLLIALGFVVALLGREPDDETADGGRREASRAC